MKLGPIFAAILQAFAAQLLSLKASLEGPTATVPAAKPTPSAVPSKHILSIDAPPNLLVGPWLKTPAVPLVHGTIPLPTPDPSRIKQEPSLPITVANAIYAHNHALPFIDGVVPNLTKNTPFWNGSVIHSITLAQASIIAANIVNECQRQSFDLPFALAQVAIESAFDPKAENGNLQGSNEEHKTLEGYDMGLCQLKLEYIIGETDPDSGAKIKTVEEAQAAAFNVTVAVELFVQKFIGLLAWADKTAPLLAGNPKFKNRYYLAAGAYNFGTTGVLDELKKSDDLSHCVHVADLTRHFASVLNMANVFAPVSK